VNLLEIKQVTLDMLHPYPNNPRKNDGAVDAVAESIKQCGYCSPIVVDENYTILAGHTRYKAMQKLGWDRCEVCVVSGLNEKQKEAYVVTDNKTSELAEWDIDKLSNFVEDLQDDFELTDMGFNEAELLEIKYNIFPEQRALENADLYSKNADELLAQRRVIIVYKNDDEFNWLSKRVGVDRSKIIFKTSDLMELCKH